MPSSKPPSSRTSSRRSRPSMPRTSSGFTKTEIIVNVYDLMAPGCVAGALWPLGLSLLHTGIVLNEREYAYGAVDAATTEGHQTGIFWTRPRVPPPGGSFRCSLLQGITFLTPTQIEEVLQEASTKFLGSEYNLLDKNCNHFTNYMCRLLTHREAPAWINRAAKVGKVLPCLIPRDWLQPPDADAVGEWGSTYDEEHGATEGSNQLRNISSEAQRPYQDEEDEAEEEDEEDEDEEEEDEDEEDEEETGSPATLKSKQPRDSQGRRIPPSEQAPSGRLI